MTFGRVKQKVFSRHADRKFIPVHGKTVNWDKLNSFIIFHGGAVNKHKGSYPKSVTFQKVLDFSVDFPKKPKTSTN